MKKHNETVLFGHFKPRFFILLFIFLILIVLVYLYSIGSFRDWQIQFSYYNSTVIGDGVSTVVIPFTILKGNEQPITVPVQVQAITNIGSVKTNCSAPSVCTITFTAPVTSKTEYANISINVGGVNGGVTKTVKIKITPDATASLHVLSVIGSDELTSPIDLYVSNNNQLYYENYNTGSYEKLNNITIMAQALGINGAPVPNGTIINFSVTRGTLSNTYCKTTGNTGTCSVVYTPPEGVIEQVKLTASSYNATYFTVINVTRPPYGYTNYTILDNSLKVIAHNESCTFFTCAYYNFSVVGYITTKLQALDVLKEPMQNVLYNTNFMVNLDNNLSKVYPLFDSCVTSANSSCTVQFTENMQNLWNNETAAYYAATTQAALYTPYFQFNIEYNNGYNRTLFSLSCGNGLDCVPPT
jgi:hypothetical protein